MWMNGFATLKSAVKANNWSGATRAAKLPTLLGEALAVWLELSKEYKEDYSKAKKAIKIKSGGRKLGGK